MKDFDQIIRDKLAGLPPPSTAPDWDELAERMDGESFDALLRRGMHGHGNLRRAASAAPAPGWDALAGRLDPAPAPTPEPVEDAGSAFDKLVADRVGEALPTELADDGWQRLSHRMDTFWHLRRKLVRYKALEIAAVVALLFTFGPLLHEQIMHGALVVATDGTSGSQTVDSSSPDADPTPAASSPGGFGGTKQVVTASADYAPTALAQRAYQWFVSAETTEQDGRARSRQQLSPISGPGGNSTELNHPAGLPPMLADMLGSNVLQTLVVPVGNIPVSAIARPPAGKWRLGVQGELSVWSIRSPLEPLTNRRFAQQTVGLGVGANATRYLAPRLELGFGVRVTPITYSTGLPSVVKTADVSDFFVNEGLTALPTSYVESESFDHISLTTLSLPVDLRVNVLKPGNRLHLWVKGGISTNLVLLSSYDVQRNQFSSYRVQAEFANAYRAAGDTDPPASAASVGLDQNSGTSGANEVQSLVQQDAKFSEVLDFNRGLAEGGQVKDNVFLSARVGLEADFALTSQLSVFGSLELSRHLSLGKSEPLARADRNASNRSLPAFDLAADTGRNSGVGPSRNRLNSFGFMLGTRITL